MARVDPRAVACLGLLLSAAASLMRVGYTDQMTFWQLMWPQLVFGAGMIMSVIPLIAMSTSSLEEKDVASGSGLFDSVRTLASALSTAAVVAVWNNQIRASGATLAGYCRRAPFSTPRRRPAWATTRRSTCSISWSKAKA